MTGIRSYLVLSSNELVFGLLLFFLVTFIVAESRWSRLEGSRAISSEEPVHVYLNNRTDLEGLAAILDDSGLLKDSEEFYWAAELLGWRNFREGHYLVDRPFSYDEFLSKLARGLQDPVNVTILPGRSEAEISAYVSHRLQFDSLAFQKALNDTAFLAGYDLRRNEVIGRLLPNTYSLYWTASPKIFLKRIFDEFDQKVVKAHRSRLQELDRSLNEIITMASIIEWEAERKDEKAKVSGLYWNRLKRGMRLQADPTVNFAVGKRRRLLYQDYKTDHPYNTYLHAGLPPGPITNPSLSSIEAALYPADHEYYYMVASPDGTHAFSKTFEEHKRKSAEWRRWLQKQYRLKEQREANSENSN